MSRHLLLMLTLFLTISLGGCENLKSWYAVEFKQGEVTSGIARLSAQHLSMITSELGKKFKDPTLPTEIVLAEDPHEYGKGRVIKTIENFVIDHPAEKVVYKDCQGIQASWHGQMRVVKATQSIYGRLTNNPEHPVIPDPNGVKMTIQVRPTKSSIKFSDKDSYLRFDEGEIKFDAFVRLAQAQEGNLKGLRVIPTSNTRFENVSMTAVKGKLFTPAVKLAFDVAESNYLVQIGMGENGEENKLKGEITAFGNNRQIPLDGEKLSPDYEAHNFIKSFSCNEGLKGAVEYRNILFEEKVGPSLAALTTLAMGKVAGKLADDYVCGMSSPAFLRSTILDGNPGDNGTARASLNGDCVINFQNYKTDPDCFGVAHIINGAARVTNASKEIKGLIFYPIKDFQDAINIYEADLGGPNLAAALARKPEPILPRSRQPALIQFTADLSGLTITEVCLDQGSKDHEAHCSNQKGADGALVFSLSKGEVKAVLRPVMGKSTDKNDDRYKMCSVRNIPVADAELTLNGVNASIKKAGNEFNLLANGAYRAVSGLIDTRENELSGDITIGKVSVPFKSLNADHVPLKPDYDRQRYEDSYQSCMQNKFIMPKSDSDCDLSDLGL